MGDQNHGMWGHLQLLLRASSTEMVDYVLQALWRTRRTGLDAADRKIFRDILQLPTDPDLDPLLVCLRVLIRRYAYGNLDGDEMSKLFPAEVLPELQRLLTLRFQKFQKEWQEDVSKEQSSLPRLLSTENQMKLDSDAEQTKGEKDVKFLLAKDAMDMMFESLHCVKDHVSDL